MPSVFHGIFREYELGYTRLSPRFDEAGERVRDPATGNYVYDELNLTLDVMLREAPAVRSSQIVDQYGADAQEIVLAGRCLDPAFLPDDIATGTEVSVTINGQAGFLRIVEAVPSPLAVVTETLGQKFHGVWRPT